MTATTRQFRANAIRPVVIDVLIVAAMTGGWILLGRTFHQMEPDFAVYYGAAHLADTLYSVNITDPSMPLGGLPFTYPPIAAVIFQPLGWFPIGAAKLFFEGLEGAAAALTVVLVFRRTKTRRIGLLVLVTSTIYASNVVMGQVNLFLLILVLTDFLPRPTWLRWCPPGVGTGIATAVKITPVVFVFYLLLAGRRRHAAIAATTAVGATAVGILCKPESTLTFIRILPTLWQRVDVLHYFGTVNNTGVTGLLAQAHLITTPSTTVTGLLVVAGLLAAIVVRRLGRFVGPLLLSSVCAMAAPVTWLHHWVALPLLLVVLLDLSVRRWQRVVLSAAIVLQITGSSYLAIAVPVSAAGIRELLAASPCIATVAAAGVALAMVRNSRHTDLQPEPEGGAALPQGVVEDLRAAIRPGCLTASSVTSPISARTGPENRRDHRATDRAHDGLRRSLRRPKRMVAGRPLGAMSAEAGMSITGRTTAESERAPVVRNARSVLLRVPSALFASSPTVTAILRKFVASLVLTLRVSR